ncbi:hypothetical protein AALM74_20305 [Parabacteroides segnis]|uniref:hypothetical protein n=1 Tax=Parabacteroides segnis TaxID=2763058 RepID=UPI003519C9D5
MNSEQSETGQTAGTDISIKNNSSTDAEHQKCDINGGIGDGITTVDILNTDTKSAPTNDDTHGKIDSQVEGSEELLPNEIIEKLRNLENSKQIAELRNVFEKNNQLDEDFSEIHIKTKQRIQYANKYIKELADNFLNVLLGTGWFDKYHDAICLFDRAHQSVEAMEWCEAIKDAAETSMIDPEAKKIRVLLNKRIPNTQFTLSTRTPYLRVAEGKFKDIASLVSVQSRSFYVWMKNIEEIALLLRDLWLEVEYACIPSLAQKGYCTNEYTLSLERGNGKLVEITEEYLKNRRCSELTTSLQIIKSGVEEFEEKLDGILEHYKVIYEDNVAKSEYISVGLLKDYYEKKLERIYGIYDGIQLAIDSLQTKKDKCEEIEKWCELLKNLLVEVTKFLSVQNINALPELKVGESHITNSEYKISSKNVEFFSFAKIIAAAEAPKPELIDRIASISSYGFYRLNSKGDIVILRETKVSVYSESNG